MIFDINAYFGKWPYWKVNATTGASLLALLERRYEGGSKIWPLVGVMCWPRCITYRRMFLLRISVLCLRLQDNMEDMMTSEPVKNISRTEMESSRGSTMPFVVNCQIWVSGEF